MEVLDNEKCLREGGGRQMGGKKGVLTAAPFSDALIFIGGAEGAIRYYDRE